MATQVGYQERSEIPPETFFEIDIDDARRMVAAGPRAGGTDA
jgi:hypothetical protein